MTAKVFYVAVLSFVVAVSSSCTCNKQISTPPVLDSSSNIALQLVALLISIGPDVSQSPQQFALLTGSMFEANAILSGKRRLTSAEINLPSDVSTEVAVAYAGYAALTRAFVLNPGKVAAIDTALADLGFPDKGLRDSIGAPIAAAFDRKFPQNFPPPPYTPPNRPSFSEDATCEIVTDPDGWQPLCLKPPGGGRCIPQMVPFRQLFNASLIFTDGSKEVDKLINIVPSPGTFDMELDKFPDENTPFTRDYKATLRTYRNLSDRKKIIAEVFAPNTVTAVHTIAVDEIATRGLTLEKSIRILFTLSAAVRDSFIGSSTVKLIYSTVRPITVFHCGYEGRTIVSWKGPYLGTQSFTNTKAMPWRPYLLTPPFPGYVSGHTTVAGSAAQVLTKYFGRSPKGANCFVVKEGESETEPRIGPGEEGFIPGVTDVPNRGARTVGYVPAKEETICWSNFRAYARLVSASRIFGGVHTPLENIFGLKLGRNAANRVFNFVKTRG